VLQSTVVATTEYAIGDAVQVRGDAIPGLPGACEPGQVGRIQELHAYADEDGGAILGVRIGTDLVAVAATDIEPAENLGPRERAALEYLDGLFPHLARAASSRDQRLTVQVPGRTQGGTDDGGR